MRPMCDDERASNLLPCEAWGADLICDLPLLLRDLLLQQRTLLEHLRRWAEESRQSQKSGITPTSDQINESCVLAHIIDQGELGECHMHMLLPPTPCVHALISFHWRASLN